MNFDSDACAGDVEHHIIAWQIQRGRDAGFVLTLVHPGKRIERSVHDTMKEARETLQAALAFYRSMVRV